MERPNGFVGQGGELKDLKNKINFLHPGFVFRVVGAGYHGANQEKGKFFYSYDKGKSWMGPYRFVGLMKAKELKGLRLTSRKSGWRQKFLFYFMGRFSKCPTPGCNALDSENF